LQEITCPEAVKLDDLDITAITQNYEAARAAFNSAESGSIAAAEAQIAFEVNKDMALALGVVLA
jgi:F0F1-type ATP synthase epsilon subunit